MTRAPDWRRAGRGDADALADLERAANLVALGHLFPPAEHPFPYAEVRERWLATLDDALVTVEVVDGEGHLDAFVAHDPLTLRHLAVHPDRWGSGLARAAVTRARGAGATRLWCLEGNHRARGLYEHLGWRPTGCSRAATWPPHPLELEYGAGPEAPDRA
ncbi:GNAT family N-acetyltransferase [Nocardioides coralli]|uniref:GNAT family N-acetyltransferase n=1 Tax=Nocardioides coralli TaxID=2872154 RepID=UPI001CA431AB|nr:GNAT family N-acetyltransferase [Nocardioides coralli]QZY27996.1 GNAT family N-acetyltransferase [Nocardioides coralli]